MKLNGWVRIWVVLSSMWILGSGFVAYDRVADLYTKTKYSLKHEAIGEVIFEFSRSESQFKAESDIRKELLPPVERNPADYVGRSFSKPYDDFVAKNQSKVIGGAVVLMALPPFLLFLAGWSFAWIRNGFRQSAQP